MNSGYQIICKETGETPLEALEKWRATRPELKDLPMTYAGRLDPMAEGQLLILYGDECKNKDKYLGADKEYEVDIVFGISTDTYDALGMPKVSDNAGRKFSINNEMLSKYVGRFTEEYPPYSSKTVGGKHLHAWARSGRMPDEMPTIDVEIYSIEIMDESDIDAESLKSEILEMIALVKGDFRQEDIKNAWTKTLEAKRTFKCLKLKVKCSAGTYMRSLANRIGKDMGTGAFAMKIKRTKLFL